MLFDREPQWPTHTNIRLVMTGGRDYTDREFVYYVLDYINEAQGVALLIHGKARGADTFAHEWALSRNVLIDPYPISREDWRRYGKRYGSIRNGHMIEYGRPEAAVAFPGRNGTANMIMQCHRAGLYVWEPPPSFMRCRFASGVGN